MVSGGIPGGTATRFMPMWLHETFSVELEHWHSKHSCALHEAAMVPTTSRYPTSPTRGAMWKRWTSRNL
jgi:hypothetical protein